MDAKASSEKKLSEALYKVRDTDGAPGYIGDAADAAARLEADLAALREQMTECGNDRDSLRSDVIALSETVGNLVCANCGDRDNVKPAPEREECIYEGHLRDCPIHGEKPPAPAPEREERCAWLYGRPGENRTQCDVPYYAHGGVQSHAFVPPAPRKEENNTQVVPANPDGSFTVKMPRPEAQGEKCEICGGARDGVFHRGGDRGHEFRPEAQGEKTICLAKHPGREVICTLPLAHGGSHRSESALSCTVYEWPAPSPGEKARGRRTWTLHVDGDDVWAHNGEKNCSGEEARENVTVVEQFPGEMLAPQQEGERVREAFAELWNSVPCAGGREDMCPCCQGYAEGMRRIAGLFSPMPEGSAAKEGK